MGYTQYARVDNLEMTDGVTADSTTVLLTMDNQVLFTSFIQIPTGHTGTIFTLDENERPSSEIVIPVYCASAFHPMLISPSGAVSITDGQTGNLYLNGVSYNIASKFYNAELGTGTYEATSD